MAKETNKMPDLHVKLNPDSSIKHVIGIVSGKGGVGKSFVTASLANQMAKMGYRVGILDADITGPSIPKMYGLHGSIKGNDSGMYPAEAENGVKIMSVNLLLQNEEEPVIWRGPILVNVVKQFWSEVVWGDLDYLFVDMPPGTGDVPLTVFQSLPVDGVIIVSSPQELVRMIVTKAYKMAHMMAIPVLGVVENYSYVKCPDCEKKIEVFGQSHIDEIVEDLGTKVLGKMPIRTDYANAADAGTFSGVLNEYVDDALTALVQLS
ncbi:Mrp/NBP35 family ATP-binding protein [Blautia liquoris]|uniref:Iron-sulfur cluster carrier protein n=1 Tax=Blautia liquoris TaxID=2779518 RepID=A0A7M2RHU5_9FIRM|nr:Mrp/NBP35 family ATP-binding protein [Blautia liquoris]QOV19117.1 Mrp/NBP35 family ATP-binding protein [Blautia liquoris]